MAVLLRLVAPLHGGAVSSLETLPPVCPVDRRFFVACNSNQFFKAILTRLPVSKCQGDPEWVNPMQPLARFLKDEAGATAIEYGLIAAGISIAIIAAVNGLGTTLNTTFTSINSQLR
jgi:pilus assembly protein Flp/PilA